MDRSGSVLGRIAGRAVVLLAAAAIALGAGISIDSIAASAGDRTKTLGGRCFMHKINDQRRAAGRFGLRGDPQLVYVARAHARAMSRAGSIWHDPNMGSEITRWRSLGQNVGRGRGCSSLFKAFMNSPTHRANVLGRWRYMGIGVIRKGDQLFVHQIFESRRNPGNIYNRP